MSATARCILMLVAFFCGLATGFPLGLVLAAVGVMFGFIFVGPHIVPMYISRTWGLVDSWEMTAMPMFLIMGNLLGYSGVAAGLFSSFRYLLGPIRGGVAVAVLVVSTIFAACTGVVAASIGTMGVLALPVLFSCKYSKNIALGSVMSGGSLGILIPPSIMLVILGPVAGLSVGKLFMGAFGPGIVLAVFYTIYVLVICQLRPNEGPALSKEERDQVHIPERLTSVAKNMIPPVLLIAGVLGSIFAGVATPTEASGVGAFVAFLLVLGYRKLKFSVIRDTVTATGRFVGMALIIALGASFFCGTFIAIGGNEFVRSIVMLGGSKWIAFLIMNLIVFIFGFFMDWFGIVFIVIPLFMPIARELGFDLIWFALMLCVNLQSSFMTPPFGYALFYMKALVDPKQVSLIDIYKSVIPFVIIILIVVALCIIFPQIIMWLPSKTIG